MPQEINLASIGEVLKTLDTIQGVKTLQQFQAQQPALVKAITDLRSNLTELSTQIDTLKTAQGQDQATIASLRNTNASLTQDNAAKAASIADLEKKLAAAKSPPPSVKPLDLASSFKNVMDQIQQQARETSGVAAATITSMDLEVKALVNVEGANPVLVLPTPGSTIDANQLSTLHVSFGAVPVAVPVSVPSAPAGAGGPSNANPKAPES